MTEKLTHFDAGGRAWMVDVGAKDETARRALAAASFVLVVIVVATGLRLSGVKPVR